MVVFERFTKLVRLQVCVLKEFNLIEIHKMISSYECVFDKKYFDSFFEKRWYAYPCFRDVIDFIRKTLIYFVNPKKKTSWFLKKILLINSWLFVKNYWFLNFGFGNPVPNPQNLTNNIRKSVFRNSRSFGKSKIYKMTN